LFKDRSPRWHTIYSIISTLIELALIFVGVYWVLPLLGVSVPLWGLITILVGFSIFSYIMYLIGHPTVSYKRVSDPESIIGCEGIVETDLHPVGYIKVAGELWKATTSAGTLTRGTIVIISAIDGLTLTVSPKQAQ
jgi:membrane protein implicated in regulation of membrane protease activity